VPLMLDEGKSVTAVARELDLDSDYPDARTH
jgi:hypothetical protein